MSLCGDSSHLATHPLATWGSGVGGEGGKSPRGLRWIRGGWESAHHLSQLHPLSGGRPGSLVGQECPRLRMGPRPLVLLSFPRAGSQPLPPCLMYELAESPWHQDGVRRQGQARQGGPGGAAACEWGAEAAMCREAKWWGVKETRVALRVQVFLLTVPDLIPKLTPSPSRDPSPGASGQTLCLPA